MEAEARTKNNINSIATSKNDTQVTDEKQAEAPKKRRSRRKGDPMAMPGAWVISDDTRQALEQCELFRELERQQLMAVAALVEEQSIEANEILIGEGEPAKHLYVVTQGRGVAQVQLERGWLSLGLVGPGDAAGWSSLVDGKVYPASVKSLTPMQVAKIETSGLTLLMNVEPRIGYPIHRSLSSIFYRQYDSALKAFKTA